MHTSAEPVLKDQTPKCGRKGQVPLHSKFSVTKAATVSQVSPGGAAAATGKLRMGDRVISVRISFHSSDEQKSYIQITFEPVSLALHTSNDVP